MNYTTVENVSFLLLREKRFTGRLYVTRGVCVHVDKETPLSLTFINMNAKHYVLLGVCVVCVYL